MSKLNFIHDADLLRCPHCDGDWLHQEKVEVFFRTEDAPTGVVVTAAHDYANADMQGSQDVNPSDRRDGINIYFMCETCERQDIKYSIIQHKGSTYAAFNK